ncbi:MAG: hemerythrin domain-containing protein [Pelagimonas sp.]|jgi:hypothetical protein|nr:hemerythrin domain-containing protein [Pelagimonas sp.]
MSDFDYDAQDYNLATRSGVSPALLAGMFPADRKAWDNDPRFLGWPAHLQRLHAAISEGSARLVGGLETVLDEPEGSVQEVMGLMGMNRLGLDLVAHVHGHHAFEDTDVLPGFLGRFPQLASAIDLLENDHQFLDQALDQSQSAFAALRNDGVAKTEVAQALEQAQRLNKIINRHTYDEEDILIPAVLNAYA